MGNVFLGIDLGTTNSTAAVFDGARTALVRNAQGSPLTPSVVRIDARGHVVVGERARRCLDSDPENTRAEFKRLMGSAEALGFAAAGVSRRPEELAAEVLRSLRADAREQLGFEVEQAVVSVPALFELPQTAATSEAARLAGFARVDLIQEPVASALAAGWTVDDTTGSWLVYDLGGGTLDVSLLETRDGLLRVVGHDGDNFLGGRDIDWAIVAWAIAELGRQGARLDRADPRHAPALRKLKRAAEEAKIELGRAPSASLTLPGLDVAGRAVDVDLLLDRETLEGLAAPIVDRSIAVCRRLLAAQGLEAAQLGRVVLVGGPTVMPVLRRRLAEQLGAPFAEGLDPMALVAEGAAIYAATAGLPARRPEAPRTAARRLWLQYPAMSSDLAPHVVGRLAQGGGPAPASLRLARADGSWRSGPAALDGEGGFVLGVELLPRQPNVFTVEAVDEAGRPVAVEPSSITIVQGLTIGDPPLARSVGVALASDDVRVYFERGAPLPARRTFVHHTVESVARGAGGCVLRVPIVQGEFEQAHLCRLVGALEIRGEEVSATLPVGSSIEVTIEIDRGGKLSARALAPALGQVFEQVARLLVPEATPEALSGGLQALRDRLAALRSEAFRRGSPRLVERLDGLDPALAEVEAGLDACRGGDGDAGQKARRSLLEIDAELEEIEMEGRWPELEERARERLAVAASWIAEYGTEQEQRLLAETSAAVERARQARSVADLQRQLRVVGNLTNAAFYRDPRAWELSFESAAADLSSAADLPRAEGLVRDGRKAVERGDRGALRDIVRALWQLLPADARSRQLGHDSGVR